jgi:LPS-assembly protein
MRDGTPGTTKNSHVSGTNRIKPRQAPRATLRKASCPLTIGIAGLLLGSPGAWADDVVWDCRVAPDGRSWECYRAGEAVQEPPEPPAPFPPLDEPPAPDLEPGPPSDTAVPPGAEPAPPRDIAPPAEGTPETPSGPETGRGPAPVATAGDDATAAATAQAPPRALTWAPPAAGTIASFAPPAPAMQAFEDSDRPDLLAARGAEVPTAADRQERVPTTGNDRAATLAPEPAPALVFEDELDAGIDWDSCEIPPTDAQPAIAEADDLGEGPLLLSADAMVAELEPQTAVFSGRVELVHGALHMQADELVLNRATGELDARGGLLISRPDIRVAGSTAHYQLASGRGRIEQASYRVPVIRARGEAALAEFLGEQRSRYQDISYTTCRPGNSDWLLRAEALELDHAEGLGTADGASLRFKGVPILYAPTFTFPIDDRRRSGLLVPSVGYSGNTGADLSVPYYFNLAENYDLTLTPRLMSKRGLLLGGEFRFLTETTRGTVEAEYLPDDRQVDDGNEQRGAASLTLDSRFNPRTLATVRAGYVSDDDYLQDLGGSLAVTSATHIERTGELRYYGDFWRLLGRVQGYQTIDEAILPDERPYSRLPQLRIDLQNPYGLAGTSYHLDAEYVYFHRSGSVRGHRVDLYPALSVPLRRPWGHIEPKFGARYTAYQLTDNTAGLNESPSHLSGVFSLDSGLFFERPLTWFGSDAVQTLEPRLFYLYVPYERQDDQPIFDTAALDFTFDNLFRENRYSGADRLGDANQATLALTSRLISDESGAELLRASVGQILYFANRRVTLPDEPVQDDSSSTLVGELAARLGGGWQTRAGLQWDPHDGSAGTIEQALAQINYRDSNRRVFNAAYRLRDGVSQQTDLAAIWPIGERISLIGRHNFSLQDDRLLEALAGLEYASCCWRLRTLLRRYTDSSGDDHNLAILVQLELNGLGRLGNNIEQTLERGIYGYRIDEDD